MAADGKPFSVLLDEWEALEDAAITARWVVQVKQHQSAGRAEGGPSSAEVARAQDLSRQAAMLLVALQQRLRREREEVPLI